MFGECYRPSVSKQRECYDRRRQEAQANKQMLRAALDAEEENHHHNAAIMAVSNSLSWSTVCSHSVSAALTASHTTSSLGQHILPLI